MALSDGDVSRAHQRLGSAEEIIEQRRALFLAAIEIVGGGSEPFVGRPDVLDNPVVRAHLSAVLAGHCDFEAKRLHSLDELVAPGFEAEYGSHTVRIASAPGVGEHLKVALRRVSNELRRHGDRDALLRVLTVEHHDGITDALRKITAGIGIALLAAPELTRDLLPHVALIAVVADDRSGRFGSASARQVPGLILIPEPRTPLEVAEALIHEGAHLKFFDLGVTRSLLTPKTSAAPHFVPSWASRDAPAWALEQSFAAWHAYHCLAAFQLGIEASVVADLPGHTDSLLTKAAARSREIGEWLRQHGSYLGEDAHRLIAALDGARPHHPAVPAAVELHEIEQGGSGLLHWPAGGRLLVAKRAMPPEFFWVNLESRPQPSCGRTVDSCA